MPDSHDTSPRFTADELDLLGRTADALSAYMGKPVLAEVMDPEETGSEWVLFAVPLGTDDKDDDITVVQVGGTGARLLGNKGGLEIGANDVYDCEYLWAIQLSAEGPRFIKVDRNGDDVAWTDDLNEILPFDLIDEALSDDDPDDDDDPDEADDAGDDPGRDGGPERDPRTLH